MTRYPNLELIQYKFIQYASKEYGNIFYNMHGHKFIVDVFMQTWSSTATGFNLDGCICGQAFTDEYTTVIKVRPMVIELEAKNDFKDKENTIYGVFFGNDLAYLLLNPNEKFYDDLRNRNILSQKEAIKSYGEIIKTYIGT